MGHHWLHKWLTDATSQLHEKSILELGCGVGLETSLLCSASVQMLGVMDPNS